MSWQQALAALDAKLDQLEQALEEDDWDGLDLEPFTPPEISGDMTPEERDRAVTLLDRLARSQERIADGMAGVQRELAELETRRRGARSYARSDIAGD